MARAPSREPARGSAESRRAVYVAAGTLAVLLALGFGWYLHALGADARRTLRVAILQPNWTLAEKKHATPEQRKKLLGRLDADLRKIPRDRYDLVVASEGTFPLLWRVDADTAPADDAQVAATRVIARAIAEGPHTEAIIGGLRAGDVLDAAAAAASPTARAPRPPARKTHNSAVHLAADGRIVDHYDKRVLVPFSEYLPFSDLIPALKNAVSGIGNFDPGTTSCRFVVAGVPMGCGICYETMFADEMRASVGDDARVLLNLTIDTWFGKTVAPEMHLMAHASRAVELGIPLVRAALTGISALVSPTGEVVASMPVDGEGVLAVDVPITDLATPYRAMGPVFAWVAAALVVVALAEAFRRRRELFPPRVVKPTVDA
ncbi:MAG: apolipoprotein N-acyltransferase [Myxococcota bacterium]